MKSDLKSNCDDDCAVGEKESWLRSNDWMALSVSLDGVLDLLKSSARILHLLIGRWRTD